MPSLINNPGNLTDVAANHVRSFVPFSRFGTRQIKFLRIYLYALNVNHPDFGGDDGDTWYKEGPNGPEDGAAFPDPNFTANSVYAQIIQLIQTMGEIYAVYHPEEDDTNTDSDSWFTVLVAADTFHSMNDGDNLMDYAEIDYPLNTRIEDLLDNLEVSYDFVQVNQMELSGDSLYTTGGTNLLPQGKTNKGNAKNRPQYKRAQG
jgi:hypothetical protein